MSNQITKLPSQDIVQIRVLQLDKELPLPSQAYDGDAGLDLYASVGCVIAPGQRCLIATGIAVAIPDGFAGFILPRSGLAYRKGLSVANAPGLIDSHYRGELSVIAINLDREQPIEIKRTDRIAQLVVLPVPEVKWLPVDQLDQTDRGDQGFGSSGI